MLLMTVASEANMARLSQIRADANRIADPRGAPAAELAAGTDAETQMALDSTVVLLDPNENPDGRGRFTHDLERNWSSQGVASEPGALNNSGSWPGPRTSHYYFNLTREWFIQSHPESRGRVRSFLQWWPHVAVDLHGWSYFRREGYDSFYPGYGEGWPMLTGSIGMLFESASSAGGSVRRNDGLARTLRQAAWEHYTAEWTTVRTSAGRRAELVKDYAQSRLDAIAIHSRGPMRVIAFERDAQGRADSLVVKLQANGIDVQRLTNDADFKDATPYGASAAAGATQLPAGSYVVDLAQPQGHLAKALLEPNAELDSAFLNFELELRRTGQRNRFYDVTAWSLPMAYRLQAWWSKNVPAGLAPVGELAREATPPIMRAQYAYAFEPGSESSLRLLASLLKDSVRVWYAPRSFVSGGVRFPMGAFVVRVGVNRAQVHEVVTARATEGGARVTAIASAGVAQGTDLGSNSVVPVLPPRVALLGGAPASGGSFGFSWFAMDQRIGYPTTLVDVNFVIGADLKHFTVLILPSVPAAALHRALGDSGRTRLAAWVRGGGVLARAIFDTLSPLTAGVSPGDIPVFLNSDRVLSVPKDLTAGEAVIRFAHDPVYRDLYRGLLPVFANAVLLGGTC